MAAKRRKQRRRRKRKAKFNLGPYARAASDVGVFLLTALIGLAATFAFFARDLPDTDALWRQEGAPKITLLASSGAPLPVHGSSLGAPVRLADLPDYVPAAFLAVEDRNFYHHFGLNPVSIVRAAAANLRTGGVVQGGSTITQQLAKNIFLSADRTFKRKIQEVMLAGWLEAKFSKDEILTLYLNRVYFGAGAYGVDAASYRYFGKPAKLLSLGEAAVLAGILKAPSRYSPTSNPEDAGKRGRLVIEQMVSAGFISRAAASVEIRKPIILTAPRYAAAPYFIDHAIAEARRLSAGVDADLIVKTTIDPVAQAAAETGLTAGIALSGAAMRDVEAAIVLLDANGAVRAMVGGRDYRMSQFNRAVQARRQPGSAFKPFVYLAALEAGASADDIVNDAPVRIGKWAPDNYESKFYGRVSLQTALAKSLNSAAIRTQESVGRDAVHRAARSMGWEGALNPGPSLALGVDEISPIGLGQAYLPFANGGLRAEAHVVTQIETVDGAIVYRRQHEYFGEAAPREAIAAMNEMLRAVVEDGTGRGARLASYAAAGKTGTSQSGRDAWFAGHAGGLVGVVWVGRDDNAPVHGLTGGRAPAIIWREAMRRALPSAPAADRQPDPIAALLQRG